MIHMFSKRYHSGQVSVNRNFRLTEICTINSCKAEQNAVIKNFLITACDEGKSRAVEQSLVIRKFLITAEKECHHDF